MKIHVGYLAWGPNAVRVAETVIESTSMRKAMSDIKEEGGLLVQSRGNERYIPTAAIIELRMVKQ